MAINLKNISISDSNNIKLDKVNYNFDQLVANGGGPRGFQGQDGLTGYQGVTGYQGFQGIEGPQGFQGPQGLDGSGIWKLNENDNSPEEVKTIVAKHDSNANPDAPSVVIGYRSDDLLYSEIEEESQFVINRGSTFSNNIEFRATGVDKKFYMTIDTDPESVSGNVIARQIMGFNEVGGKLTQVADEFTWSTIDNNQLVNKIELNPLLFTSNIDTVFNQNTTIEGTLIIKSGNPAQNKIAVSSDTLGTIEFKSIDELGGVVPVGTIVSVDPSFYNEDTFITESLAQAVDANSNLLHIEIGKGIGPYSGWYLCNGEKWIGGTDDNGNALEFETPNLNSFSYDIQSGPEGDGETVVQGGATTDVDEISIIGGADVELDAAYSSATWNITTSVNTQPVLHSAGSGGTTFKIKKLPQIIFLGNTNLYWTKQGTTVTLPEYTFAMWQQNGGSFTAEIPNTGGSVGVSQANDGSSAVLNAGDNPTSFGTNTGSQTSYAGYEIQITPPSNPTYSNSSVTHTFSVLRRGGYSQTTYNTLSLSVNGTVSNAVVSLADSDTVVSGNNASVSVVVTPNNQFEFTSVRDITDNTSSPIQKTLLNGQIIYSVSKTITSNESYSVTISSGSATPVYVAPNDIVVNLELSTPDSNWEFEPNTSSTFNSQYTGPPNGEFTSPTFKIKYVGSGILDHPVSQPSYISNPIVTGQNTWSRVTGEDAYEGSYKILSVGSNTTTQSIGMNLAYSISQAQAPSLSVSELTTVGQNINDPGGKTSTEQVQVTAPTGVNWQLSGPTWVAYSPSSGTGNATVTATVSPPTTGNLNSDRSGTTTLNSTANSAYLAGSATGSVSQDNTFFTVASSGAMSSVGSEGDTIFYDVITNMGFVTFDGQVGGFMPSNGDPTPDSLVASTIQVEHMIPRNDSGRQRTIEVTFMSNNGPNRIERKFFIDQASSGYGTDGNQDNVGGGSGFE